MGMNFQVGFRAWWRENTSPLRKLRRGRLLLAICGLMLLVPHFAAALEISNRYRSPRNAERRIRPATRLIVLHTTEAHARSSLNKLSERGEAHYCLVEDGTAYRIIDRDRVAFHAGRSMWNGREDCDDYAIGIEVVGFHDKPMPLKQLNGLKELVDNLKKIYGISDANVVCHSHVAYGAPNRWQRCRHRGRKRCGMLFAMWSVRTRIGLKARPAVDPDVRAGRLVQADKFLEGVLYGKTDTMSAHYARGRDPGAAKGKGLLAGLGSLLGFGGAKEKEKAATKPACKPQAIEKKPEAVTSKVIKAETIPAGALKAGAQKVSPAASKKGADRRNAVSAEDSPDQWRAAAKFVSRGKDEKPAAPKRPQEKKQTPPSRTKTDDWYLLPDGRYFQDDRLPKSVKLPPGTRTLVNYALGGPLGPGRSAYSVVGKAWKEPTTFYVFGGKVVPGNKITAAEIPAGARVFHKIGISPCFSPK